MLNLLEIKINASGDLALANYEQLNSSSWQLHKHSPTDSASRLHSSFASAIANVKTFVLKEFDREIAENQLYYHNHEHINNVQRRANTIFRVICPYWQASLGNKVSPEYITRISLLLDLCAVAHDMIQVFVPQSQSHTPRRRETGVSERLTIEKLSDYIKDLNQQLKYCVDDSVLFTEADLSLIQDSIWATICVYDPDDQSIYQPALYDENKNLSIVARIIALADIGSLGMDGIATYNHEGSLLFLEENPDVIPIILNQGVKFAADNSESENIRQRLLRRARFQVNFAKSRFQRYSQEISSFPRDAISTLTNETFQYLNPEIIQEIELTTPTDDDTSLEELMVFFKLEELIKTFDYFKDKSHS